MGCEQMTSEPETRTTRHADGVYLKPSDAEESAREVLDRADATAAERSEALATLGRSAYYDNRLSDAIAHLERALSLATSPSARADISLTLAPALSKAGRPVDALELLELDVTGLSDEQRGKLHNQRGIIDVETGRLPEALTEFGRAREIHRAVGDAASEGRSLVNMAAAASELGRLSDAESWYVEAWRLNQATGQDFSRAIIEGNLGYVASRRGDFGAALDWYRRGRTSFSALGDVDLLVAVLETDHATTLLDLGLDAAALEAAEYARTSAMAGDNRLLHVQSLLLVGEAQLRLGRFELAEKTLTESRDAAEELGLGPVRLRSGYLLQRLRSLDGHAEPDVDRTLDLAAGLRAAGWHREALRTLVDAAHAALGAERPDAVERLLSDRVDGPGEGVDPFDAAHADALVATAAGDDPALTAALRAGQRELERERQLVNSAELERRLGHRLRDLRELVVRRAVAAGDAAAVLDALDRIGTTYAGNSRASPELRALQSQLRDVRVGLQEALLAGRPADELRARSSELEREILAMNAATSVSGPEALATLVGRTAPLCVSYIGLGDRVHAVTTGATPRLIDLGPVAPIHRAMRAHRTGLRRLAAGEESATQLTAAAAAQLAALLVEPLELPPDVPVAVVTDGVLAGVCWAGIDGLADREFFVARSIRTALATSQPLRLGSVGLVGSAELGFADDEIDSIEHTWGRLPSSTARRATLDEFDALVDRVDLLHVAAHGTFRADNPFASALHLADGDRRFFDLERHDRLPDVMVLAACDSGASTEIGAELFGTPDTLLSLGVRVVCASRLIVDDGAAFRLVADLHRALAAGVPPTAALSGARRDATERGTPQDRAAAAAFLLHADLCGLQPIRVTDGLTATA